MFVQTALASALLAVLRTSRHDLSWVENKLNQLCFPTALFAGQTQSSPLPNNQPRDNLPYDVLLPNTPGGVSLWAYTNSHAGNVDAGHVMTRVVTDGDNIPVTLTWTVAPAVITTEMVVKELFTDNDTPRGAPTGMTSVPNTRTLDNRITSVIEPTAGVTDSFVVIDVFA